MHASRRGTVPRPATELLKRDLLDGSEFLCGGGEAVVVPGMEAGGCGGGEFGGLTANCAKVSAFTSVTTVKVVKDTKAVVIVFVFVMAGLC